MKKVLFIMHTMGFGGAERSLVNLLQELPFEEYKVDLLLFQKKGALLSQLPEWVNVVESPQGLNMLYAPVSKAGRLMPVKLIGTGWARLARRTPKGRAAFRWKHAYRRWIEHIPGSYDVAVAYGGGELLYLLVDRVSAKRKLAWIHTDYKMGRYSAKDDLSYLEKMDAIVSISEQCVQALREAFPELRSKMHCIENITSSTVIRRLAGTKLPEEFRRDECNILSVGRLNPVKGYDMAIEAARILKDQGLKFRWFVLGEGFLRTELEMQIREKGLSDSFFLLGARVNPYPYIRHCTFLVQSSRYEGKSVALDEAKILGAPIIATAYPTVVDQIHEGAEGIIAEMSPQGIAEAVSKMIRDSALRENIRKYLLEREYGNQNEVVKYENLLNG